MDVQRPTGLNPEQSLRERGLRATRPRVAVLAALRDLGAHRSAEEVRVRVAERGEPLPRSSVYGVLDALVVAGLVMTADAGPGVVLYELGDRWHHHFVCRVCHGVTDVECVTGAKPCLTPGTDVGTVDEAQVIFRGVCTACASGARA
ncbi:Fur family transcriptional regulator [Pseudonocardia sp. CA-107938]|uniref:Fur family transcriptional regulator n=1 Tax=Pseudonocardia sp. CA-107938 TaxID=3240021 RepID=UPI003D934041